VPDDVRTWCRPVTRIAHGKAYREILGIATEDASDLIVMGVQMGSILGDMMRPTDPAAHARVLAWQAAHHGFSAAGLISAIVGGLLGGFAVALQAGSTGIATAQLLDRRGQQHLSEVFE